MGRMKDKTDYPFYNGQPEHISLGRWIVVFLALAVGFTALTFKVPGLSADASRNVGMFVFTLLPLAAFAWAARGRLGVLFRKVRGRDIVTAILFFVLNFIVTGIGAFLIKALGISASANASANVLAGASVAERIWFYASAAVQLVGEELITILPLLAIMQFCYSTLKMNRKLALVIAVILSAVIFGALHLPTYNWNFIQAMIAIGLVRIVITGAYLKSKNIWVSSITHILNDWTLFTIGGLTSSAFLFHGLF